VQVHRGVTGALVLAVPIAALLDGWCYPPAAVLPSLAWLDVAAVACLAWAALQPGAWRDRDEWSTPFDGLVLAMLALATVGTLAERGAGPATQLLRQSVAFGGAYFGLACVVRRTPGAAEFAWRALALAAAMLGAHALWAATDGLGALARHSDSVDARWTGSHGLARMIAFATLATAGRAVERNASAPWRLACCLGVFGLAVHAAAGGFDLDPLSLARLDAPMDFSTACVTWLLVAALARAAWSLRRERRAEAWRWRALAAAMAGLGALSVLGDGTGGEGVRALAVLAALAILGSPGEAEPVAVREEESEDGGPLARAA
jgi:hypothetical protein